MKRGIYDKQKSESENAKIDDQIERAKIYCHIMLSDSFQFEALEACLDGNGYLQELIHRFDNDINLLVSYVLNRDLRCQPGVGSKSDSRGGGESGDYRNDSYWGSYSKSWPPKGSVRIEARHFAGIGVNA